MKLRNLIIRILGVVLATTIFTITILAIIYAFNHHEFTYVIGDNFGKSKKCYIDKQDHRVCEIKKEILRVEMFYEEM